MTLGTDFRKLWFGQTVSVFGDAVTALALPTTAIVVLHAPAFAVGALAAVLLALPLLAASHVLRLWQLFVAAALAAAHRWCFASRINRTFRRCCPPRCA